MTLTAVVALIGLFCTFVASRAAVLLVQGGDITGLTTDGYKARFVVTILGLIAAIALIVWGFLTQTWWIWLIAATLAQYACYLIPKDIYLRIAPNRIVLELITIVAALNLWAGYFQLI